jgi:predicted nucleotide-binding protein
MTRRPAKPVPASPPTLNPDQIRRRIQGLERCIDELKAFDPQTVQKRYNIPEVVAIETSITDALGAAFGHGTDRFRLFEDAARLDQGPHVARMGPAFGRGPTPDYDAQDAAEARDYLAEGKQRSIQLLGRAIRALQDDLADHTPADSPANPAPLPASTSDKVFVVHGHDEAALQAVARFLEKLGLDAIILREQADQGRAIIEKFEDCAGTVGFAVVLLTPDDLAGPATSPAVASRARQNVIFELGYFAGKLGRGRACLLRKGEVEIPSDLYGVIYTDMDAADGWKIKLVRELKAAKLDFDANRMWT